MMKLRDVTLHNVQNFIQGTYNFFRKDTPKHINEQANWRANKCPEGCGEAKALKCCGCKVPEAFFAPKKKCLRKHWGPMLSEEEWNKFKLENNVG